MTRRTPNPLDRLHRDHTISLSTALVVGLMCAVAGAPLAVYVGIILESIIKAPFGGWCA